MKGNTKINMEKKVEPQPIENKKKYSKPELSELGHLIEFTLGSTVGTAESGGTCGDAECCEIGVGVCP